MSHFTVLVRLTAERMKRAGGDVEAALAEILAPYEESPDGENAEKYLKFEDQEEEWRKEYAEKTVDRIRMPNDQLLETDDDRFKVEKKRTELFTDVSYEYPADAEKVKVPVSDVYPTFEEFAKAWYSGLDEKTGKFGYWSNPNAKWDWYSIGGRWTGFFPTKPGVEPVLGRPGVFCNQPEKDHADVVVPTLIDHEQVDREMREKAQEFWAGYKELLEKRAYSKNANPFEGPRSRALDFGLIRVEQKLVEAGPNEFVLRWGDSVPDGDERRDWCDVIKILTEEEFNREWAPLFYSLSTYSALDDEGWHTPGEMGWFGMHNAEADAYRQWKRDFKERFILSAKPNDLLVIVDCHI